MGFIAILERGDFARVKDALERPRVGLESSFRLYRVIIAHGIYFFFLSSITRDENCFIGYDKTVSPFTIKFRISLFPASVFKVYLGVLIYVRICAPI